MTYATNVLAESRNMSKEQQEKKTGVSKELKDAAKMQISASTKRRTFLQPKAPSSEWTEQRVVAKCNMISDANEERREPGVDRFVTSAIVGGAEGSLEFDDDAFWDVHSEMHKLIRYQRSMRENLEEKGCQVARSVRAPAQVRPTAARVRGFDLASEQL